MSKGPEAKFQDKVVKQLRKIPDSFTWKIHDMVTSGIPDVFFAVNGVVFFFELKADKGKPTILQLFVIEKLRKAGLRARVVYPHEWDEVYEEVLEISRSLI